MKVIGIDLDGTITPFGFCDLNIKFSLPWWLCCPLFLFFLLSKPKKAIVEKMRLMKDHGYRFIIVTRWPDQFFRFIKRLLIFYGVPFDGLFCVGFDREANKRKLKIIKEKEMEAFIDSSKHVVEFLKRNSVNAVNTLEHFN